MAANAYMADITENSTRTKRMAILAGLWPVGSNIGKALSGLIKANFGLIYNFVFGLALSLTSVLYVLFFVTDSKELIRKRLEERGETAQEGRTTGNKATLHNFGEKFQNMSVLLL